VSNNWVTGKSGKLDINQAALEYTPGTYKNYIFGAFQY